MHALVTADAIGGVWTYARELVTGLAQRGVRVTLVSFGEIPTAEQTEWMDGLKNIDFRPTAFRLEWMQECEEDIAASSEYLRALIREIRPDVLHLNQYCYGSLECDVPKVVVAHSDVVSWWVGVHGEEPRETKWMGWYRDTVRGGISDADAVVAPSRWMLEALESHYTAPRCGSVIYNGRNPGLFNPHLTKEDLVVSVGRVWDPAKQVALLAGRDQKVDVVIAGSDKHPDEVMRGARPALPARRKVQFRGVQSGAQLAQLMGRASLYAATSRYEPFGLAPLEAAFSRCAIVANDIPTFREVWGEAAYYFHQNDAGSLADAINRLTADRQLRLALGNLAYARARERYTATRMVDQYLNLYESLVSEKAAAA